MPARTFIVFPQGGGPQVNLPVFTPPGGSYSSTQNVMLSDTTPGALIYYTTDGSNPTTASTLYTIPIVVTTSETLKAVGTKTGILNSAIAVAIYVLPANTPTFSPPGNTYGSAQTVAISSQAGATIWYTTDGTTPVPGSGSSIPNGNSITVSVTETVNAIATATGYLQSAVGSATYTIGAVTTTVPDITALRADFPAVNVAAYTALNVQGMPHGTSFNDPVTNVVTWKITDSTTPASAVFFPWYSQMGLEISQPWGANNDQYHLCFIGTGGNAYLCDFGPSWSSNPVGPYNYRNGPPGATNNWSTGTAGFSRKAGNPHIMYIVAGSPAHIRLYNVLTNVYVDATPGAAAALGYSASWPTGGWPWTPTLDQWFMVNAAETWATARSGGSTMIACNLVNGTNQTWSVGVDDVYCGYGDSVTGDQIGSIWNLDSNTHTVISPAYFSAQHGSSLRGYWMYINSASGNPNAEGAVLIDNTTGAAVIGTGGSSPTLPYDAKYWGYMHSSGNWWLQAPGPNQYSLQSNFKTVAAAPGAPSELYAISFVNVNAGTLYRLGYSYCIYQTGSYGVSDYWTQPHAHISHDGKLSIYGSNMLGNTRIDLFLMETPLMAGTPPSFP